MQDLTSSPDPLNDSATYYSPRKTRRATRQSLTAQSSSPTKQTFELDVGNKLSPQKLIVTVEAESDRGYTRNHVVKGQSSPSRGPNKTRERTTTTTIPVKGLSDSEDEAQANPTPKKGRGRPRKSIGTPVPTKKGRNSTPTRKKSIGDLIDGDDQDDVNYQMGKNVEVGRGKGKSRSRSTKGTSRKSTPVLGNTEIDELTTTKKVNGRLRRKSVVLDEPVEREDSSFASVREDFSGQNGMNGSLPNLEGYEYTEDRVPLDNVQSSPPDFQPSSRSRHENTYMSPSLSPDKSTFGAYGKDSVGMVSEGRQSSVSQDFIEQEEYEDEEDDEVGELREYDTILESEEFSMISVDSVPSLRNLSSPAVQEDKPLPQATNKSIENLREAITVDDSFSSVPDEVLIAATPARRVLPRNLSVPATVDNSFSSIPPEILAAATPAAKRPVSRFQSAKSIADDSFSTIAPEILQAATPARVLPKKTTHIASRSQPLAYGDDYSTTPIIPSGAPISSYRRPDTSISHALAEGSNGTERRRVVSASHSTTSRLLTPVGSSPEQESSGQKLNTAAMAHVSGRRDDQIDTNEISLMHSYMPSSPPLVAPERFTYTAHLRRHSQLHPDVTQTPSIVFSSPSLPPPINGHREQAALKSDFGVDHQVLSSPVARAGQALQDILVPSSPRSRSASLGSPFKSPAPDRKSSSVSKAFLPSPSQERGIKHVPKLDWNNNLFAGSQTGSSAHQARQDDPFSNYGVAQQRSPSPEEDLRPYKLGVPGKSRSSDSRISTIKSADLSMSDDAMSWQAEAEVSVPNKSSSARREQESIEQEWVSKRAAVSKQINSANPERVIMVDSEHEGAGYQPADDDDDEDLGLLLETINSSSPAQAQEERSTYVEKPRRSKIPSPWRNNGKRLVYSDELSHLSSPAALPEVPVSRFTRVDRSQPVTVRRIETPILSDEIDPANLSNWQIPQKSNFQPRVRDTGKLDLSALLSPVKPLPILPRSTRPALFDNTSALSAGLQDIISNKPTEKLAEPIIRREDPFAPIPQKMGFNPTPRNSSPAKAAPAQGLFNNIPKSHLFTPSAEETSTAPSQDRSPLLLKNPQHLNRYPQEQETPSSTSSSTVAYPTLPQEQDSPSQPEQTENARPENRTLKWTQSLHLATKIMQTPLPDRTVSPTKSCFPLRTPQPNLQTSPSKNVQFVSSSPVPSSPEQTLSATEWSKKHWLLLESILQTHQAEEEAQKSGEAAKDGGRKRRNSTRVISRLLGKKVSSQGEEMFFEQWHLEVVDEFRGVVPGWEEKVIAMRVFAIIVGAERRRLGLID